MTIKRTFKNSELTNINTHIANVCGDYITKVVGSTNGKSLTFTFKDVLKRHIKTLQVDTTNNGQVSYTIDAAHSNGKVKKLKGSNVPLSTVIDVLTTEINNYKNTNKDKKMNTNSKKITEGLAITNDSILLEFEQWYAENSILTEEEQEGVDSAEQRSVVEEYSEGIDFLLTNADIAEFFGQVRGSDYDEQCRAVAEKIEDETVIDAVVDLYDALSNNEIPDSVDLEDTDNVFAFYDYLTGLHDTEGGEHIVTVFANLSTHDNQQLLLDAIHEYSEEQNQQPEEDDTPEEDKLLESIADDLLKLEEAAKLRTSGGVQYIIYHAGKQIGTSVGSTPGDAIRKFKEQHDEYADNTELTAEIHSA